MKNVGFHYFALAIDIRSLKFLYQYLNCLINAKILLKEWLPVEQLNTNLICLSDEGSVLNAKSDDKQVKSLIYGGFQKYWSSI